MELRAWLVGLVMVGAADACRAGVVRYDNSLEQFEWRPVIDGYASFATWLDITLPASQSGAQSSRAFEWRRATGTSTPHFNEDRIVGTLGVGAIVRRPFALQFQDEEGIPNSFSFARSFGPDSFVGPAMDYHWSAHIAVTNFYTTPLVSRVLPTGMVGVSVTLDDGVHYGWIHVEPVLNPSGVYLGYRLLDWGYETTPGVPIAVPAPSAAIALTLGVAAAMRRRRE